MVVAVDGAICSLAVEVGLPAIVAVLVDDIRASLRDALAVTVEYRDTCNDAVFAFLCRLYSPSLRPYLADTLRLCAIGYDRDVLRYAVRPQGVGYHHIVVTLVV